MYDRHVDEPRLTFWHRIDEQSGVAYQWLAEIDRIAQELAPYGCRMACTDGWIDGDQRC
jgi:hypothetical protein